jgi:hypothetical protein
MQIQKLNSLEVNFNKWPLEDTNASTPGASRLKWLGVEVTGKITVLVKRNCRS